MGPRLGGPKKLRTRGSKCFFKFFVFNAKKMCANLKSYLFFGEADLGGDVGGPN